MNTITRLSICGVLAAGLVSGPAAAERTKLLEVDLRTGSKKSIDAGGGAGSKEEADLDAMLDKATGGKAFSTQELEKIEGALRRYLTAARPRAMPRLMLFVYPGRITPNLLRELREVKVDVELMVDPCSRTVCTDAVAKTLDYLGKAVKQAVIKTSKYTIRFGTVTVRTATEMAGTHYDDYRFGIDEVVQAAQRGGASSLMGQLQQAKESYPRAVMKEIVQRVKARRVSLTKPPAVQQDAKAVSVDLEIKSDRVRVKGDVLSAMAGTAEALRKNPLTPSSSSIQVVASVAFRAVEQHRFSCMGQPLMLYLDGRMSQSDIWATYIVEKKKGGQQMTFDDAEAAGKGGGDDDGEDEDRSGEILGAHMSLLAPCLSTEAARSRSFKGATLQFAVSSSGQAVNFSLKEAASSSLRSCLQAALGKIRFQKHRGAPRQVTYPMFIKR